MSHMFTDHAPRTPLGKAHIMLATTAYDSPDAAYTFSIARSREALHAVGFSVSYILLTGNCHVDDARNTVIHEFMQTDCSDLVFLDADVSWKPEDLVKLCEYDLDLVGGVYPYRREDQRGKTMPFVSLKGATVQDGLLEVVGLPTGFMRISRRCIEALIPDCETFNSKDGKRVGIPLLFERTLVDGTRYGGDINFCLKWASRGGKLYAAVDFHLGHTGKTIVRGSLAAHIRRQQGTTLRWVADRIRARCEAPEDYTEVFDFIDNPWGASDELLIIAVAAARNATGPILETGSGLSTVLMAAANPDQIVFCLEHNPHFANQTRAMAQAAGVTNIAIVHCELVNGFYSLSESDIAEIPKSFALALHDGPPRQIGNRNIFFSPGWAEECGMIICDDADNPSYRTFLEKWTREQGKMITFPESRSAIIMEEPFNGYKEEIDNQENVVKIDSARNPEGGTDPDPSHGADDGLQAG